VVTKKDKHLAAAQKFLERGSLEKALIELQGAVKEDAKDTRTWLRMAEVHVRLGQNDKATEVYQKTVDLYVEQGFFQRAVAVYKNIIKLSPESVGARIKLADVYKQLGLFSDAIQQLEQAVALHQRAGEITQALSALKQILDLNPDQPATRIRYAELAVQAGQNEEAVAEFREAANLLKTQGRTDEFARVAERILYYTPEDFALGTELARIYLDRNNARAALTRLKPAFESNQSDPEVLDFLARCFEMLGQPNKSLPVLKELCRVYANSGRMSERNQTVQRALALDPNDAELRAMLGRTGTGADTARGAPVIPLHRMPALAGPSAGPAPVSGPPPSTVPRSTAITFSEMEVPEALQNRYKTPSADLPPGPVDRVAIASGMVEKTDDEGEIKRILAEADTFVKYGLVERAAEHLRRVFERVPTHTGAHERLAAVLVQLGRRSEAAAEMEVLAQQLLPVNRVEAADYARRALNLNPNAKRAADVLAMLGGKASATGSHAAASAPATPTPEPEAMLESGEIELLGDGLSVEEENAGTGAVAELAAAFGSAKVDDAELSEGFGDDRTPSTPMDIAESVSMQIEIHKGPAQPLRAAPVLETQDEDTDAIFEGGTLGDASGALVTATMEDADSEAMLSDLEQVDFFIEQDLVDDAHALLNELEARHPGHVLVADRREKLQNVHPHAAPPAEMPTPAPNVPAVVEPMAQAAKGVVPTQDLDTEADLGVMNKTMERHDLAIQHFTCLLGDPKREVFALTMIGESQEALGNHAEAIRCYQDALRRPRASEDEATQLYFLLGNVFYDKGDRAEALYYFERVCKRDPTFRDVQRRLAALKSRGNPH
jgi:tetratricopeptide (TPR) repeat protein